MQLHCTNKTSINPQLQSFASWLSNAECKCEEPVVTIWFYSNGCLHIHAVYCAFHFSCPEQGWPKQLISFVRVEIPSWSLDN